MSNTLKVKRGTNLSNAGTPEAGELIYRSDTNQLFVGNGTTAATGLSPIGGSASGDIEGVTAGTGLSGGGTSGTVSLAVDLSELTDMTASVNSSQDELIILDNGADRRKLISEIPLSAFNNDSGFITTDTTLSTEQVQDIAGGMFSSNTETGIAVSYVDGDGTIDLTVDYLPATDDRDVKPSAITTSARKQVRAYFTSLGGLTGTANSDYQDLLVLDTYSDGTGGDVNALAFDKSEQKIRHYLADQSDTSWGTAKVLAYEDTFSAGTGLDLSGTTFSVDVSDFMTNGVDNRVLTATGTDGINAESSLTFNGTQLTNTGNIKISSGSLGVHTNPLSDTGSIVATNDIIAGYGGGGIALTINDGGGNANVTFNHRNKVPEQNGQAARIEVNTDATSTEGLMYFEVSSADVTSGSSVTLENALTLAHDYIEVPSRIRHMGDTNTYIQYDADRIYLVAGGTTKYDSNNGNVIATGDILDQDNMSSNSATAVASQQSIKAYVDAEVAGVVNSAPAALNTLDELAAALGDDANFATTTSTSLGNRLRVDTASQGLTGTQQANAITNLGITATKAELNYVDGVTSAIQTQLDAKLTSSSSLNGSNITSGTISTARLNVPSSGNWFSGGASVVAADGVMEIGRFIDFHNSDTTTDDYHIRLDCESTSVLNVMGGTLEVGGSRVLTVGDEGSGNGLDADTLDGLQLNSSTRNNQVNTVVRTQANGYALFGWINTTSGNTTNASTDYYVNTDDGYIRKKTLANVRTEIMGVSSGSSFLRSDANDTATGTMDFTGRVNIGNSLTRPDALDSDADAHARIGGSDVYLYVASLNSTGGYKVALQSARGSDFAAFGLNLQPHGGTLERAGNTIWDAGNDGSGSGLDADTLDGVQGSSFVRSDADDSVTGIITFEEAVNLNATDNDERLFFKNNGTTVGDIGSNDTTWLRINQSTNKNIYTPRYIRADGGFFIDGSTLGLTGTGKLVLPANHDVDKITMYAGGNEKIGTEANTLLFTADNHKFKDTAGHTNVTFDNAGNISATADVIAYASSDKRLKDNLKPIENSLDKVSKLSGYEFDWNDKQETYQGHDIGVVAQEVEEVLPELVTTRENGYKAVKYEKIVALLIESIKELKAEIEELKK